MSLNVRKFKIHKIGTCVILIPYYILHRACLPEPITMVMTNIFQEHMLAAVVYTHMTCINGDKYKVIKRGDKV